MNPFSSTRIMPSASDLILPTNLQLDIGYGYGPANKRKKVPIGNLSLRGFLSRKKSSKISSLSIAGL